MPINLTQCPQYKTDSTLDGVSPAVAVSGARTFGNKLDINNNEIQSYSNLVFFSIHHSGEDWRIFFPSIKLDNFLLIDGLQLQTQFQ